jgi:two-component system cell cycle response regulator
VLRAVGQIVDDESRGIDEPARYGGEEFVVALPETSLEGALEVGERIRTRIAAQAVPRVDGGGSLAVTASLGAAVMGDSIGDVNDLIAAADAALYEAKRAGKNRVVAARADGAGRAGGNGATDSDQAKGRPAARRK